MELVRGSVFSSAYQRWCLGLVSLDRHHYKHLSEMQSMGVWRHILSVFKSHRGTTQQAIPRAVSWLLLLLFHILHSLTWCIYYLQWIMEHFHSFIIRSSVKNIGDKFPSFEAFHLFFTRPTNQLPPTESFNALDCFFPCCITYGQLKLFFHCYGESLRINP